jgi:hypothetical protein
MSMLRQVEEIGLPFYLMVECEDVKWLIFFWCLVVQLCHLLSFYKVPYLALCDLKAGILGHQIQLLDAGKIV